MIRPWEEKVRKYKIYSRLWEEECDCEIKPISDDQCKHKRGDIVKIYPGYYESKNWRGWFMTEEDKKKYLTRNVNIPLYAANQFAILMTRYKRIKTNKYISMAFRDYGSHLLFLTGRPGKLRKFFGTKRYYTISQFPYTNNKLPKPVLKLFSDLNIINLPTTLCNKYNRDKAKMKFLEIVQDLLGEMNGQT